MNTLAICAWVGIICLALLWVVAVDWVCVSIVRIWREL